MSYKTIKNVTELTGITEGALRYYDEKDVIRPTIKKATGRREWLYDDAAIKKLCLVKLLTFIGVPVKNAGLMLKDEPDSPEPILNARIKAINAEMSLSEYKISLAQKLLEGLQQADRIDTGWLLREIQHIRLLEEASDESR